MTGKTPGARAAALERRGPLVHAGDERLLGYGVMGLAFGRGDVLALRRVTASSIGPAYSSVWHRDAAGGWTVFTDGDPTLTCPRYLGSALDRAVRTEVRVEWIGDWSLSVSVPAHQLDWAVRLEARARASAWSALVRALCPPGPAPAAATILGAVGGRLLGTSPLRLQGQTPNGQWFVTRPTGLWVAAASVAVVGGRDLGPVDARGRPARLGDLVVPDRGLFMTGEWRHERYDPDHHHLRPTAGPDTAVRRRA